MTLDDVEVVTGKAFITSAAFRNSRHLKVLNLCRSHRYQSIGYYVSLLASARGLKPDPAVVTIQDMKSPAMLRQATVELTALIQESLMHVKRATFDLDIFFGHASDERCARLSSQLTRMFHAPLMRAHFVREESWTLKRIGPLPPRDIPLKLRATVTNAANAYISGKKSFSLPRKKGPRFNLAIMTNPSDEQGPSNAQALRRFVKAAEKRQIEAELITRDDAPRIAEFDALFIRETTAVNHYTYRIARSAESQGLVVIDDPDSILKCTNKVFLTELLQANAIPAPRSVLIHRKNVATAATTLGFPLVLKQPDGSFSRGVKKASTVKELMTNANAMLESSELVLAQEFMQTEFDWRVGVLDGKPLYVCKYHMADRHWQIINRAARGDDRYGLVECIPVDIAPKRLISLSLKAAALIGNGFYGLDLKQSGKDFYLIEINDNPTVDYDLEDALLKDELYLRIMDVFLRRIVAKKQGH